MRPAQFQEKDIQILGAKTNYQVVRAEEGDMRGWLQNGEVCPLLAQHNISHVGVMDAAVPFEVIRHDLGGTFMIACFEGEGVVLADGKWQRIRAGQACLQPPFMVNALKAVPGKVWKFAWVRYRESRERLPVIAAHSPIVGRFNTVPLRLAIEGLHSECSEAGSPWAQHYWSELIHHYVISFAQPHQSGQRLWQLWKTIEADLRHPWTLAELASIVCMSEEHLRRLSKREIGRSPMQHLTFLRLQRAVHLLSTTNHKVEFISREVGFESSFTFSNTFKKWFGWRPSEHRMRTPGGSV